EAFRNIEAMKEIGRFSSGSVPLHPANHQRLGHDVDRRHARNGAQKLTDIAERAGSQQENLARLRLGDVDSAAIGMHSDVALVAAVSAKDHLEDRAFARTRPASENCAFSRAHGEFDARHDRKANTSLQVHAERLGYGSEFKHGRHHIVMAAGPRTPTAVYMVGADRPAAGP